MPVFYNENNPYAAQWLRNLIAKGHLPDGVVDEINTRCSPRRVPIGGQCHFFAGIGVWPRALDLAGWPDSATSGPAHAHASLSPPQAKAAGLMTSGTYGPPGSGSSASIALTSSLASRLKARLDGHGSTLFSLTWKHRLRLRGGRFPCCGRRRAALRHRIYWVADAGRERRQELGKSTTSATPNLVGWREVKEDRSRPNNGQGHSGDNGHAARLAGWPTPQAKGERRRDAQKASNRRARRIGTTPWSSSRRHEWKATCRACRCTGRPGPVNGSGRVLTELLPGRKMQANSTPSFQRG